MLTKGIVSFACVLLALPVGCNQDRPAGSSPIHASTSTTAQKPADRAPTPTAAGKNFGSCSFAGLSCADYEGTPSPTPKDMCGKYSGKWSDSPCPQTGIVGTCLSSQGGVRVLTHSYPPGTAESAKKACSNTPGGQFSDK
jgi:hypothetical protein